MKRKFLYMFFFCNIFIFTLNGFCSGTTHKYHIILFAGDKIGYEEIIRDVSEGQIKTTSIRKLSMKQENVIMDLKETETCIVTKTGKLISYKLHIKDNGSLKSIEAEMTRDGNIAMTTTIMGKIETKEIRYPSGSLTREELRFLQKEKGLQEGTKGEAKVLFFDLGVAANFKWTIGKKEKVNLFGKVLELIRVDEVTEILNTEMKSTAYINENFSVKKLILPMAGEAFEMIACSKERAQSQYDKVDIGSKTLIKSPRKITPEELKNGVEYLLKPAPGIELDIPESTVQSVRKMDNGTLIVSIRPLELIKGIGKYPYQGDDPVLIELMQPTPYLQSDNKELKKRAYQVVRSAYSARGAIDKIERFVCHYIINKTLSVSWASALEVFKNQEGDCTEHALLTAALCRAVGIPSRVVVGIVYAGQSDNAKDMFEGHAWAQAYIENKWIDLDATLPPGYRFDAGHIALMYSTGDPRKNFRLVNTMGNFKIVEIRSLSDSLYVRKRGQVESAD